MALKVLEKSLNFTLHDMYEPWIKYCTYGLISLTFLPLILLHIPGMMKASDVVRPGSRPGTASSERTGGGYGGTTFTG